MPIKRPLIPALLCLLTVSTAIGAESASPRQAIEIRADKMQLDIYGGDSEYQGNVLIRKGEISLQGDRVLISRRAGEVQQITVEGDPASYQQKTDLVDTSAQSSTMLFDVSTNILTMKDSARLQHDDQIIESNYIQFDTDKQLLLAGHKDAKGGTDAPKQRVNIILSPSKKP